MEVLVKFNGSWSQHVEVPEGEKEIPTVKVPEVVADDVVLWEPGGQWLGIEAGGYTEGESGGKPLLILTPL